MVKYILVVTAEMENVADLSPMGGPRDPSFRYYFKLKCENCGEKTKKESCVCLNKQMSVPGTHRRVQLWQKCRGCGREGIITMEAMPLPDPFYVKMFGKTYFTGGYNQQLQMMKFETQGLEPFDVSLTGPQWKVVSKSGIIYENVDLGSGEWMEYDEKMKAPVVITYLKCELEVNKGRMSWHPRYWK